MYIEQALISYTIYMLQCLVNIAL